MANGYTRRQELRCTVEELSAYGSKVLLEGELLYVKQSDGSYDIKIGDGRTNIATLPYIIKYADIKSMRDLTATNTTLTSQYKNDALTYRDETKSYRDNAVSQIETKRAQSISSIDSHVGTSTDTASAAGSVMAKLNKKKEEIQLVYESDLAEVRADAKFSDIMRIEEIHARHPVNQESIRTDVINILEEQQKDHVIEYDAIIVERSAGQLGPVDTDMYDDTVTEDGFFLSTSKNKPTSTGSSGVKGMMYIDAEYLYVCIDSNTWKKIALSAI